MWEGLERAELFCPQREGLDLPRDLEGRDGVDKREVLWERGASETDKVHDLVLKVKGHYCWQ